MRVLKVLHEKLSPFFAVLLLGTWAFIGLPPVFIFVRQIWDYLQTGRWQSFSGVELLAELGFVTKSWAAYPDSWVGIHKIVANIPGAILWLVMFIPLYILMKGIAKSPFGESESALENGKIDDLGDAYGSVLFWIAFICLVSI